ncbi:pyruvate decarboxylase [Cadophora sp. DSE1049]|nr:pyruvate decarboxylase [Cadophora sp. DSE1049]
MSSRTVNIAEYLYRRLVQLGCKSLHGLPGDFNLLALDFVEPSGLRWVGNCNEVNAGYAADAYARVTGLGAIMTTFGVGELSAVNAVAGAYAEVAPLVHILGTPPKEAQNNHLFLHHTLGNGDYQPFARIHKEITIAQADLVDVEKAPAEIDRVLRACYVESRPVYIQLPTDMVTKTVDASLLETPIDLSPSPAVQLYAAQRPVVLVNGGVQKRRITGVVDILIKKLQIPVFAIGKGAVDETLPFFAGLYAGDGTDPQINEAFNQSDLILTIGNIQSDLNTAGFTAKFPVSDTVALHYTYCLIGETKLDGVPFKSLIPRLTEAIETSKLQASTTKGDEITHAWLWPRLTKWFQQGDLVVTDTGTSYVGYWSSSLQPNTQIINQILWSSIGYGVGAAQGAALAAADMGKGQRTICLEGDGSFQLTAQEIFTIIRHNLNVTMFVIENDGYTIERFVHGLEASYNDVARWKYAHFPWVCAPEEHHDRIKTWRIRTRRELEGLLDSPAFAHGKGLQFAEMHMPKLDAPQVLKDFGENAAKQAS